MIFATPLPLENQCDRPISTEEASTGIALTVTNANELLSDAKILFDNGRYARAIALSVLAIEEIGKVELIKNLLLSPQKVSTLWRNLRSHKFKSFPWMFPMMKRLGVNDPNVILALTSSSSDPIKFLDQLKQICFYVEAVKEQKKCVWWLPSEITDEQLAKVYLGTAYEVVMDDRIKWTPEALEVFKRHAKYENEIAVYADMLGYYTELFNNGHITEDRFLKLKTNIQKSSPAKDVQSDK